MAARPEHLARLGDVLLRQAGKAEPLGLQMHRVEQGKVIQERRNRRRQHHLRVADAHKFRHDKADRAHDRRGELAAGGGHRLDRRRKILLVARFFHQRDGDRAGRRHVGDGRAVNHAHQRGGDHRHLRRAAGVCPTSVSAISLMNWEKPLYLRNAPKSTNTKIYVAETPAPVPRMPLVSHTSALMTRLSVKALVPKACRGCIGPRPRNTTGRPAR